MRRILFTSLLLLNIVSLRAQQVIPLYDKVPGAIGTNIPEKTDTSKNGRLLTRNVVTPTLTVFVPEKNIANGSAVIICPGGGYSYLVMNNEGTEVAKALSRHGITAFVLKYRLPNDLIMKDRSIGPLQDAQQAIKHVREHAKKWSLDTAKIGIMGFSAGGHLASTLSTHYKKGLIANEQNTNLRPSFSVLVYPVISFQDSILHKGSKKALIGETASVEQTAQYSNEFQVIGDTPPTFLIHCSDDKVVPVDNSIRYYQALKAHKVKAELHIYATGGHGFGLNNSSRSDKWFDSFIGWMKEMKLI